MLEIFVQLCPERVRGSCDVSCEILSARLLFIVEAIRRALQEWAATTATRLTLRRWVLVG